MLYWPLALLYGGLIAIKNAASSAWPRPAPERCRAPDAPYRVRSVWLQAFNLFGVVRSPVLAPFRRLGQRILYRWYSYRDEH